MNDVSRSVIDHVARVALPHRVPRSRPARLRRVATAMAAALLLRTGSAASSSSERVIEIVNGWPAAAGEVLVRYSAGRRSGESIAADIVADMPAGAGWHLVRSRRQSAAALVAAYRRRLEVEAAEPNYAVHAAAVPDDLLPAAWALRNLGQAIGNGDYGTAGADINAAAAWDRTTGSRASVVAVIDSGIVTEHEDLAANVWSAPRAFTVTIAGVTITCGAGTHGFNVLTKTCDPSDDFGHGTHVAGIIGAVGGNGIGTVGVNWTASMMAVKFLDASGSGFVSDAINAIEFAIQAKQAFGAGEANIRVLNNSWNGAQYSQALADEIDRARAAEMLFVASAGNTASDNESAPQYPAGYATANVVSVAATDYHDELASFSNYGQTAVHIAAPGSYIYSTYLGPPGASLTGYATESGTSMAAAFVSGTAALVLSRCNYSTDSLRTALLGSATSLASLQGRVEGARRLNAAAAVNSCDASGSGSATNNAWPYGGTAWPIPGTVHAENFDAGGEGVAYHDTTAGNSGGAYRSTDVDIEPSSEGTYDVGWTAAGEWLNYTVVVASSGSYAVAIRAASPSGGVLHVGFNGPSAGTWNAVAIPATGGWQNWTTISVPVVLGAGTQQMTVMFDTSGINFMSATVTAGLAPATAPYGGVPTPVPGTIQAANFDEGGEGVSYHDTTPSNAGGAYRSTDVDIEPASGGGYDVGWIAAGEWLNYTVTVTDAGSYGATLRVASPGGGSLHLGFNGPSNVWTTVQIPATGGWQNWTTVSVPVTLGRGLQQITVLFDTGGFNFASIDVR
jgi:subtilisin family serine protease